MAQVSAETLAREEAERKQKVETKAHADMAKKASDMKVSRLKKKRKRKKP